MSIEAANQELTSTLPADDGGSETPASETGGQETGGEQQATGEAPAPKRKERRDLWRENKELREQVSRMSAETAARAVAPIAEKFEAAVSRLAPKEPSPEDKAIEEFAAAARNLDPSDPASLRRFALAQAQVARAGLPNVEEAVKTAVQKYAPQPQNPAVQALYSEFDWAGEYEEEIAAEAKKLARKHNRDLRDPRLFRTTLREAALRVAKDFDLDVPGAAQASAAGRFASTSGRTAGAGGAPLQLDGETLARIDQAAAIMYPELAPAARRAKWLKDNAAALK